MIIIDSNIWIFGELENTPEHDVAVKKYREAVEKDEIGINVIIASEVFHTLYRLVDIKAARERLDTILSSPSIEWIDMGKLETMLATGLAESCKIRINDALIAQQALAAGAKVLTDNVKDFRKVRGLEIIPMR